MGDIKKNEFRGSGILKSVSDSNSYYGEWSNSKLNIGHVFTYLFNLNIKITLSLCWII